MNRKAKQFSFTTNNFKVTYGTLNSNSVTSFINISGWCSLISDINGKTVSEELKNIERSIKYQLKKDLKEVTNFDSNNYIIDIDSRKTSIKDRKFGYFIIDITLKKTVELPIDEFKTSIEILIDSVIDNCLLYTKEKIFNFSVDKPIISK